MHQRKTAPFSATPPPRVQGARQLGTLERAVYFLPEFLQENHLAGSGLSNQASNWLPALCLQAHPASGRLCSFCRFRNPLCDPAFLTHRHSHTHTHTHPCRFLIKAPSLAGLACQSMPTRHSRAWAELIGVHSWVSVMLGAASQTGDKDSGSRLSPGLLLPGNAPSTPTPSVGQTPLPLLCCWRETGSAVLQGPAGSSEPGFTVTFTFEA